LTALRAQLYFDLLSKHRFEERQQLLTARRVKISERAAQAETALGKAAVECRYHSETLRQFHSEFAHLPRLTQAVNVLKGDLQQTLQLCNQLESTFTDVTEGKVLLGLEKWRDEEWAKMKHYKVSKTRELDQLEAQVIQKQQQVEQKKAARAAVLGKPPADHTGTQEGSPSGTVTAAEGSTSQGAEEVAVAVVAVAGVEEVEEEEDDGEDYYVTSSPKEETSSTSAAAAEEEALEEAAPSKQEGKGDAADPIEAPGPEPAALPGSPPEPPEVAAGTPSAAAAAESCPEPAPLVVESKKTKKKKKKK